MKKLMLLLLCIVPVSLFAVEKPADKMIDFLKMEQKHKKDWFDYKKDMFKAKMDMLQKHKAEMFAMKTKHIKEMTQGTISDKMIRDKLQDMVKMHEQHNNDWKKFHESFCKKGSDLGEAHHKELADFKKSLQ